MSLRIVIRHISGTRMHQTDEFSADGQRGITVGRDEAAGVRFDPQREDMVSREHLRITPESAGSENFVLSDLNSRNGTFLNHQRISRPTRICHNDIVQLGLRGPEFRFELDPPPAGAAKPTRLVDGPAFGDAGRSLPTREISMTEPAQSRPIGRATVERMLGDTFGKVRKESNKTLWIGVAALFLIAVVGTTTVIMLRHSSADNDLKAQEQQKLLLQMAQAVHRAPSEDPAVKAQIEQISLEMKKVLAQNQAERGSAPTAQQKPVSGTTAASSAASATNWNAAFAHASQQYKKGDATAAYQECYNLIAADQSRWEPYYLGALSATALGRADLASTLYQYALDRAPDAARADITQKLAGLQATAQEQPSTDQP